MDKRAQLQRRFDEVKDARESFDSAKDIKNYYGRILDFVEYVETDTELKKLLEKNLNDKFLKELETGLVSLGEEVLEEVRRHHAVVKNILKEKSLTFPTWEEVHAGRGTGIFSITREQSIGMDIETLDNILRKDIDVGIEEVPKIIQKTYILTQDLKNSNIDVNDDLKELIDKEAAYRRLLDQRTRRLALLRIPEYLEVLSIKDAINDGGNPEKGMAFKFTGSYKYAKPTSDEWMTPKDPKRLQQEKEKYFMSTQRTYHLILDLLDGKRPPFAKRIFLSANEYWGMPIVRDVIKWLFPFVTFWAGLYWHVAQAWIIKNF